MSRPPDMTGGSSASEDGPAISVVFPVHDNPDQIRRTLPPLLDQDLPGEAEAEIVAVDDGSGPDLASWLTRQTHPALRVVTLPANRGRAAARNAGFRASRGRVVVFLDSDVLVGAGFLAAHLAAFDGPEPERRMSLGLVRDTESFDAPRNGRAGAAARVGLAGFTTANVAIARPLLEAVQETADAPFDVATFTRYGWEDLELEQRLLRLSPRRVRSPGALGLHHCPSFETAQLPRLVAKERERAAMARRFLAKHPRLAVRLMVQATPLHRALWAAMSLGGLASERRLAPLLDRLVRAGRPHAAATIARLMILNPAYMRAL